MGDKYLAGPEGFWETVRVHHKIDGNTIINN